MFIQTIQENVNFDHPEQPQPLLHQKDKILFPTKQFFDEPMPNLKYFNYDIYSEDSQFSQFNQISNLNILRTQKQPPPLKIKINEKKKDADPLTKYILENKRFQKKNNNTVRFLVDLVVENLPKFADQYSEDEKQKILQLCSKERAWHLSKKKNVYNFDHLKLFFSDNARQPNAQKTRQIFGKILREESIKSMKRPKSQIHDKIHYLRVVKIFNLRCRNQILSLRNQYR